MSIPTAIPAQDVAALRRGRIFAAAAALYTPRPAPVILPRGAKPQLYDIVASTLGDQPLTYLEFGVHRGWSSRQMAQRFHNPESRFIGFDSFRGLPEDWGRMARGTFSTGGAAPDIDDARVSFVKGWFQNTVAGFLAERAITGRVLVHFDADLYSSTLFLLTTLWHHIPAYHFIFDEFPGEEMIAMNDFRQAYPIEYEFIAATQWSAELPDQLFGRLRNVPLEIPDAAG